MKSRHPVHGSANPIWGFTLRITIRTPAYLVSRHVLLFCIQWGIDERNRCGGSSCRPCKICKKKDWDFDIRLKYMSTVGPFRDTPCHTCTHGTYSVDATCRSTCDAVVCWWPWPRWGRSAIPECFCTATDWDCSAHRGVSSEISWLCVTWSILHVNDYIWYWS